jgi:hypothetical protein
MLRSLATMTFALIGSAAAWAGPGTDFCDAMRQNYKECSAEAMQPDANGRPTADCPNAKNAMRALVPNISANAISELRTQIPLSYGQWLPLANTIAHSGGLDAHALADLQLQLNDRLNAECYKLQMLDY